jgi:hypothetical protein
VVAMGAGFALLDQHFVNQRAVVGEVVSHKKNLASAPAR